MTNSIGALTAALGIAVAAIATEHEFSATMSSPWSVDKFVETQEDKDKVWKLFWWSAGASIIFAIVIALILDNYWGIIASIVIIGMMWYLYNEAVEHRL